jgi:tetratricopeptide (TPR) repeat protein
MTRFVVACQAVAVRRLVLIFLTLLAFGAIKLPIECNLRAQDRSASGGHRLGVAVNLREQVSQVGFVAALSGFRSIIADVLFIQANAAWERTEWGRVLSFLRQATTLQPHAVLFWDMAAWHMGWNASVAALTDRSQPHLALRIKAQREYLALAKDFLERGIRNNPEQPQLYETLARLYRDKYNDHERASEFFAKAAVLPGAMSYDRRFSAYELSYVEGREREAHERLRQLYDAGESERLPTLIRRLKFLEDKLGIPQDQRVPDAELQR